MTHRVSGLSFLALCGDVRPSSRPLTALLNDLVFQMSDSLRFAQTQELQEDTFYQEHAAARHEERQVLPPAASVPAAGGQVGGGRGDLMPDRPSEARLSCDLSPPSCQTRPEKSVEGSAPSHCPRLGEI